MFEQVENDISELCERLSRPRPKLIAVSKMQPNENVENVLKKGHRVYGENRVQEAQAKWPEFSQHYGKVELHLLGPLQTNKVKQAVELFDVIHSLDRPKLAQKLAETAQALGKCPDLFVQVNIGDEPQKAGVAIGELPEFIDHVRKLDLPIMGVMCIPPVDDEPRAHFRRLKKLADDNGLTQISMGMSGDYLTAIEEGATHVRVGSAIFGARHYA